MLPKIKEQIKSAKSIAKSNDKIREDADYFNKLYNEYNGKNYEYVMRKNSNNTGNDFYQIKETGSNPAYSNQARALELEPNNIIIDGAEKFNPAHVAIFSTAMVNTPTDEETKTLHGRIEKNVWEDIPMADPWKENKDSTKDSTAQLEFNHIFTPDEIGKMSQSEFSQKETSIMQQMENGLIQNQQPQINYSGYTNPVNGSGQIYSREDIGAMTTDEYTQNEQAINAQLNSIGIPTNKELETSALSGGSTVYVPPYTRSDGTQVKGYYRSK